MNIFDNYLFEVKPIKKPETKCKQCEYSERHQCNSKIILYCGLRKSGRTSTGLFLIKANQISCEHFKKSI